MITLHNMRKIGKKRFLSFAVVNISILFFLFSFSLLLAPSSFAYYDDDDECECSSDLGCGIGYRCVKPPFSSCGVCMKEVDRYGNPVYRPPDPSIRIKSKGDCDFDLDCPIGFYCHPKYKVCVKKR